MFKEVKEKAVLFVLAIIIGLSFVSIGYHLKLIWVGDK